MSDEIQPRRRVVPAIVGIVVVAIVIGTAWYLTSPRFHDYPHNQKIVQYQNFARI